MTSKVTLGFPNSLVYELAVARGAYPAGRQPPALAGIDGWFERLKERPAFIRAVLDPERVHVGLPPLLELPVWHRDYQNTPAPTYIDCHIQTLDTCVTRRRTAGRTRSAWVTGHLLVLGVWVQNSPRNDRFWEPVLYYCCG